MIFRSIRRRYVRYHHCRQSIQRWGEIRCCSTGVATSLKDAGKRPESIETLRLEGDTKDLKCTNVFCEAAGGPCICRLSRWIEQTKPRLNALRCLSLRGAKLGKLPESLFLLDRLEELDLRDNDLTELSESISKMTELKILRLDGNNIDVLPESIRNLVK